MERKTAGAALSLFTAKRRGMWGQRRCIASTQRTQAEPVGHLVRFKKTKGAANTTLKMRLKPKFPPSVTHNLWLISDIFRNKGRSPIYHLQLLLKEQSLILYE